MGNWSVRPAGLCQGSAPTLRLIALRGEGIESDSLSKEVTLVVGWRIDFVGGWGEGWAVADAGTSVQGFLP